MTASAAETAAAEEETAYLPVILYPLLPNQRMKLVYVPVPQEADEPSEPEPAP